MANTDYALPATLQARLTLVDASTVPTGMLQALCNVAARIVDAVYLEVRRPPTRSTLPCFSESASLTRTYPDPYMARVPEPVPIDDLLTCTAVTRGGVPLTLDTDYALEPGGTTPKTALVLEWGAGAAASTHLGARRNLAVTGIWGYCTTGTRPVEVGEATLLQAVILFQRYGADLEALAAGMRDPFKAADAAVRAMLIPVTWGWR